jgi:hypothetical protein
MPFTVHVTVLMNGGVPVDVLISAPDSVWARLTARVAALGCSDAEIVLKKLSVVLALFVGSDTLVAVTTMEMVGIEGGAV